MSKNDDKQADPLERIFHEPNRLAIMSALCAADKGLAFSDLRDQCGLTDGNLSRHLQALREAEAVDITKTFVGAKPRTTVQLSGSGLRRFSEYLAALEEVLRKARQAIPREKRQAAAVPFARTAKA